MAKCPIMCIEHDSHHVTIHQDGTRAQFSDRESAVAHDTQGMCVIVVMRDMWCCDACGSGIIGVDGAAMRQCMECGRLFKIKGF